MFLFICNITGQHHITVLMLVLVIRNTVMQASNVIYKYEHYQTSSTIQFGQQRRWSILLNRDNALIHSLCASLVYRVYRDNAHILIQVVRHQYLQYVSIFLSLFPGSSDLSDGSRGSGVEDCSSSYGSCARGSSPRVTHNFLLQDTKH